jgi:hypothetical protein
LDGWWPVQDGWRGKLSLTLLIRFVIWKTCLETWGTGDIRKHYNLKAVKRLLSGWWANRRIWQIAWDHLRWQKQGSNLRWFAWTKARWFRFRTMRLVEREKPDISGPESTNWFWGRLRLKVTGGESMHDGSFGIQW